MCLSLIPLILASLLAGCSNTARYSSGEAYATARDVMDLPLSIDAEIAKATGVEPHLRFPAKIGVARIVNGTLTLPSPEKVDLFAGLAERHQALGGFEAVSPLIAGMLTDEAGYRNDTVNVVRSIRLGAARQHLDYVLIYEAGARSRQSDTPFALADITLIGAALLPTRSIRVTGIGQALFLDVRNGYACGNAQAMTDLSGLATSFGAGRQRDTLRDKAAIKVTAALIPEIEAMLAKLLAAARS